MGLMPLHDFTLPDADGGDFTFDADVRKARDSLLFFYRGSW
jgi:peroxiredoxin